MNNRSVYLGIIVIFAILAALGTYAYSKGGLNLLNPSKLNSKTSPASTKMTVTTILLPSEKKIPDNQLTLLSGRVEKLPACIANLLCFKVANTYATELTPERIGRGKVDYIDSYLSKYVGQNVTVKVAAIAPMGNVPAYVRVYGLTPE